MVKSPTANAIGIGVITVVSVYLFNMLPPGGTVEFTPPPPAISAPRETGIFELRKEASIWLLQPHVAGDRYDSEGMRQFIRHKGFTCDGTVKVAGLPKISEISCGLDDCNSGYIYELKDYGGNLLVTPWTANRSDLCEAWESRSRRLSERR